MPGDRKRMTVRRLLLEDIINSKYYKKEGFEPNFIITPSGINASRVEVVGTVMDTYQNDEQTYGALTLDDGSEVIRIKFFQDLKAMEGISVGDIIQVIGKVREYDDEIYVQPENINIRGMNYEMLHLLDVRETKNNWKELVSQVKKLKEEDKSEKDIVNEFKGSKFLPKDVESILKYLDADEQFETANEMDNGSSFSRSDMHESEVEEEGDKRTVLGIIEDLDDGEGAGYSDIIEKSDMSEERVETVINDLLSDGTCYEPKPGKIKKL